MALDDHHRQSRRRHCHCCHELFDPDPRLKDRQKFCTKTKCQSVRQRQNEQDWRKENSESRQEQNRKWQQKHSGYSRQRRLADPRIEVKNRKDTRLRMEKLRYRAMFDKSKSIMTQVVGGDVDKCYLIRRKWLMARLTRASPLSKPVLMRHNRCEFKRVRNHWFKGGVHDLGGMFKGAGGYAGRRIDPKGSSSVSSGEALPAADCR